MDGCLSSELYDKAHQDLCLDRCGLDEIRKNALYRVTPDYSISMLHEWRKDGTNIRYLAEATPDTAEQRDIWIYKAVGFTSGQLRGTFALRFMIVAVLASIIGTILYPFRTGKFLTIIMVEPIIAILIGIKV